METAASASATPGLQATPAPRGEILIYPRDAEAGQDYPPIEDAAAFRGWFAREGYVVVRRAVPGAMCDRAVQAFLREVLPDRCGLFERHVSGRYERHVLTEAGFMQYPIMNLQDLSPEKYPGFRMLGLQLLTQPAVRRAVQTLLGERGRIVHTMYFDGNQTTWAHRDGHYLDAEREGQMIGVWLAAEDIHPDAGRFFVVPRSHRMQVPGEGRDPNGEAYKASMAAFVRDGPLPCVSPVLRQGDLLLWTSLTVHGSLPTADPRQSRRSFTAHYVPRSQRYQWNVRARSSSRCMRVNGVEVMLHAGGTGWSGQLQAAMRDGMPRLYGLAQALKKRWGFRTAR